jgi:2-haloacid dehalogenase
MQTFEVKALLFDVLGTVVDWRGSIIREGEREWTPRGMNLDWASFADAWRAGYQPAMDQVRQGRRPWVNLDVLHRELLDHLLAQFGVTGLDEAAVAHLNRAWHRLDPWPDTVAGLTQLRERFIIAPLSNGHVALLLNMAKRAGLPWDCILSAELARRYKPDPEAYLHAVALLGLQSAQVMMVAAHLGDLIAARGVGMKTAFVRRPLEFGPDGTPDQPDGACDIVANNFPDLARQLAVP